MIVLICDNVSSSLRGELTRWLLEPKTGVFVGNLSAMVREKLWQKTCSNLNEGGCIMIYSTNCEQGFKIQFWGNTKRWITEFDGLQLITIPS